MTLLHPPHNVSYQALTDMLFLHSLQCLFCLYSGINQVVYLVVEPLNLYYFFFLPFLKSTILFYFISIVCDTLEMVELCGTEEVNSLERKSVYSTCVIS